MYRFRFDILYTQNIFPHMIHIHTTGFKELITRQSFEAFTASLKMDPRFYLCSRGVVINLEHAVDFDRALFILDDETRISVSRKLVKMQDRLLWIFCFKGDIEYEYYIKTCSGAYGNDFWSVPCLSAGTDISETPPADWLHGLHLFWQESVSWKEDFVTFLTSLPAQCFFPLCWY